MRRILTIAVAVATLMTVTAGTASAGRGDNPRADNVRNEKVDVCHYDVEADEFHLINVSAKAVERHLSHGDASPLGVVSGADGTELDAECRIVATATALGPVVEGEYLRGSIRIGLTLFELTPGEFSGTGSYHHSTRGDTITTDIVDACIDPDGTWAIGLGVITTDSSDFIGQYTVVTLKQQTDGSIWAFSRLKPTLDYATTYFSDRCDNDIVVNGPGSGFLSFS